MPAYQVAVTRTTFYEVDAVDQEAAIDRCLGDVGAMAGIPQVMNDETVSVEIVEDPDDSGIIYSTTQPCMMCGAVHPV